MFQKLICTENIENRILKRFKKYYMEFIFFMLNNLLHRLYTGYIILPVFKQNIYDSKELNK